ncbi:hypothetical protein CFC21_044395 [Triticum aestivum]|uniref:Uncharacterized protein n=3 Tax=Triticum TaxID=4564 RepID=A0A9R1FQW6_WHEAT|nr:uncharacterized protein LOC123066674 [Triticum aestivum]KAF7033284.1 hypothetical protein CFC21_044395 [Triticum aestivum]CDM86530.1 unnamed protein product [Triticum aestivum]VAH85395.1 unnamed protein product [Triticum turgidum subsp. durum]
MGRKASCISLVILALVLAAADAKSAAGYSVDQAATMRLEDGVAPELGVVTAVDLDVRRHVLHSISPQYVREPSRPACVEGCGAPGERYTGRDCKKKYQCG